MSNVKYVACKGGAMAVAAAMLICSPAQAAVSGSVSLTNLQYQLSGSGDISLQLVPNTYYGPDGSLDLMTWVTQSDPYMNDMPRLDRPATVPLMSGDDATLHAELASGSANLSLRTLQGATTLNLTGEQHGGGSYFAFARFGQGSWGLDFGPVGQGLLLSAHTTLTLTAQAKVQVASGGDCLVGIDFTPDGCDTTGGEVYMELAYNDTYTGQRSYVWDQLTQTVQTVAPGVSDAQQGQRDMVLTLTNDGDTPMPIAFRYRAQLNGYGYGATAVPEPAAWCLMGLGLVALFWRARRSA